MPHDVPSFINVRAAGERRCCTDPNAMLRVTTLVFLFGFLGLAAAPGYTCTCADPAIDPIDALNRSSLVVAARVVAVERLETPGPPHSGPIPIVRLQVLQEWKGSSQLEYSVYGVYAWHGDAPPTPVLLCDHEPILVGEEYLVFASRLGPEQTNDAPPAFSINQCFPNGLLRTSADAVRILDKATGRGQ
jgi:hypothetical protein